MRLRQMIKMHITWKGISQKIAAKDIGIGESTLCRFLKGQQNPEAAAFMKIIQWVCKEDKP